MSSFLATVHAAKHGSCSSMYAFVAMPQVLAHIVATPQAVCESQACRAFAMLVPVLTSTYIMFMSLKNEHDSDSQQLSMEHAMKWLYDCPIAKA